MISIVPRAAARIAIALASALAWLLVMPAARAANEAPVDVAVAPVIGCAAVAKVGLDAAVGAAVKISGAAEKELEGARYCVVSGVIAPRIRFEARLPVAGWTGRYLQIGCGGLCGMLEVRVEHAQSCVPVREHAVVLASTDMGHEGMGGDWAEQDPATRADFGYRGVHLTAVAVKALIAAYYGKPARYAYFSGCSDGGREALIEAQRFPADFDGIAAGAPALNFTVQNSFYHGWNAVSNTAADGRAILTGAQLPLLHRAVLAACDALDGSRDGVIEDPRQCRFDPGTLECQAGQAGQAADACLTAAQVATVRAIYAGAHDAQGRRLVMGGPMPGSELAWQGVFVPPTADGMIASRSYVSGAVPNLLYATPKGSAWSLGDLKFDAATLRSFDLRGLYDATDPDLSAFKARGGKLLMWHGWSDPHISPKNSIGYYEALVHQAGRAATLSFARLFLLPGVYHCGDGEGPVEFDVLEPLMAWVEAGHAPTELAQHGGGAQRRTYAYPDSARRGADGQWQRVAGRWQQAPLDWLGASFFSKGYELR